jgi:hypothetical protein
MLVCAGTTRHAFILLIIGHDLTTHYVLLASQVVAAKEGASELDMRDFGHAIDSKVCVERDSFPADEDVVVYFLFFSTLRESVRLHGIEASFAGEEEGGKPELRCKRPSLPSRLSFYPSPPVHEPFYAHMLRCKCAHARSFTL